MTLIRRRALATAAALPLLLTAACGSSESSDNASTATKDPSLVIVSTVAPITSILANIAGDRARIEGWSQKAPTATPSSRPRRCRR